MELLQKCCARTYGTDSCIGIPKMIGILTS